MQELIRRAASNSNAPFSIPSSPIASPLAKTSKSVLRRIVEDEVEGWWALTDEERQDWRRAKRDKELGFDD